MLTPHATYLMDSMSPDTLFQQIQKKQSYLCVGLDTDIQKIPEFLLREPDPVAKFNQLIIEATHSLSVAYKLNIAFYESMGPKGWEALEKTLSYIPEDIFVIADAKRGDIGNTSRMYARTFFEYYPFDAITVAPYMGQDSVTPFLEQEDKWVFILALTSNPGAQDFQFTGSPPLYQRVVTQALTWEQQSAGSVGFVVGATREAQLAQIRQLAPDNFFLVPGVGAQGGSLEAVCKHASNSQGGLLINSSRSIIYASTERDFPEKARNSAQKLQQAMAPYVPAT